MNIDDGEFVIEVELHIHHTFLQKRVNKRERLWWQIETWCRIPIQVLQEVNLKVLVPEIFHSSLIETFERACRFFEQDKILRLEVVDLIVHLRVQYRELYLNLLEDNAYLDIQIFHRYLKWYLEQYLTLIGSIGNVNIHPDGNISR